MNNKKVRKLLTIEDLVRFCSEQNFNKFSSEETGYKLSVQVPATFEVDENVDDDHRGMMKLKFRIFHTGLNRNGSYVSENAAKLAMPTIKNRPIMASIHQLDSGEWDFEGHNMEIVTNEDGEEEIVYIEKQVGSFAEGEPFFEYDPELDKTYVCAYGYVAEEYTKATEIIKAKNGTKNSCELSIEELSYNAKEHYLDLQKFYVMGSTLLGSKKDGTEIGEGMLGSRADIAEFSEEKNSYFSSNEKLIEMLEQLNNKIDNLSNFAIDNNQGKEEANVENNEVFEEVTETEEVVEVVEESTEEVTVTEEVSEESTEETPEVVVENEVEVAETETEVVEETVEAEVETTVVTEVEMKVEETSVESVVEEVEVSEKFVKIFEISHEDIRCALYGLLAAYEDMDNEWYYISSVYDTYFTYENWCGDKVFGQSYVKDGDTVSFDGERYNLHKELLTDQEYAELMSMRSNYEALVQFKKDTEDAQLHTQREAIVYDARYSVLAEKDENNEYKNASYAKLVSEMDNYSLTDLEKELKSVFADYITSGGQFAYADKPEVKSVSKKTFTTSTEKKISRYGNLFKK